MIPVKPYVIVDFLSWIRKFHPNIESLRAISEEELYNLCREFIEIGYIEFMHEYKYRYRKKYEHYSFEEHKEIFAEQLYNNVRSFLDCYIYKDLAIRLKKREPELFHLLMVSGQTELFLFFDWISKNHPEIDLLTNIPDEVLKNLINEFTKSHRQFRLFGTGDAESLLQQLMKLKKGEYYKELFEELLKRNINIKKRNRSFIESVDPLKRYKTIPLHAIFLYTSQHNYVQDYIIKHWGALSSMSGDYCDIYFSIDQLDYETDAFDVIEQIKVEIDISKLPGILFWESDISSKYFLSFEKLDDKNFEKDLTMLLLSVFQQIRALPIIDSIIRGETLFKEEYEKEKAGSIDSMSKVTINVGTVIGDVIGEMQGDFIKNKNYHQILTEIFKSLEWSKENKERIERLEESLKYNAKAIEDVQLFINKVVEKNISNKNFIDKLKDFAYNISTSFSSSFVANAIWAALVSVR